MENKYVEELRQEIKRLKLENKQLILLNQILNDATKKYSDALTNLLNYLSED